MTMMPLPVGSRFGEWTVLGNSLRMAGGKQRTTCRVRCSCGNDGDVLRQSLVHGQSKRCQPCGRLARAESCTRRDIVADDKLRRMWRGRFNEIMNRCERNPRPRYGQRGIRLHPAWMRNFRVFMEYIKSLQGWDKPELELDRVDNDRGYEPGNMRMATRSQNMGNSYRAVRVEFRGRIITATDFWNEYCDKSTDYQHVRRLLKDGVSPDSILNSVECA